MGIDDNNQLYSYFEESIVNTDNQVTVAMDSISDADLTAILDAL